MVVMMLYNNIGEALADLNVILVSKASVENLLHEFPGSV